MATFKEELFFPAWERRHVLGLLATAAADTRASQQSGTVIGVKHRSKNVAFDAVSCATVRVSSEGGPANLTVSLS